MAEPDLLELFRKHAQDGQKEMVSLFCNDVRRLSRTKKIKRLLVLGRYAGNSELCGHVLRVLEMLPELPGMACPAYRAVLVLLSLSRDRDVLCRLWVMPSCHAARGDARRKCFGFVRFCML